MVKGFSAYIGHLLKFEGGYVNDPVDTGGETKYGISKRAYPFLDIKSLDAAQARAIYYRDYWKPAKCDQLPAHLQFIHFDTAVNAGINRANKILQKAIGTVVVDGIVGPKTLAAASTLPLAKYVTERCLFYARIVKYNPSQVRFLVGWIKRVKKVADLSV